MKRSIERLSHFRCDECRKWWSIGDAPEDKADWFCPWCGATQSEERMDKFIIYKRPGCVWCDRALDLLDRGGCAYEIRDIAAAKEHLQHLVSNGFKTVPQIYHGDKHVGGHDDLVGYLKTLRT